MAATAGSDAYADWVQQLMDRGLEPWFVTYMFRKLAGSRTAIEQQMLKTVERVYGLRITRVLKHPRARKNRDKRPIALLAPDLPIFKHVKQNLKDISVNNGLHIQGIILECQDRECSDHLAEFMYERWRLISHICPELERIDVRAITHDVPRVTSYVFKQIERRISADSVLILPRTNDELQDGGSWVGRNSSVFGAR